MPGYESADERLLTDERLRASVGERLAAIAQERLDGLDAAARELYDRLLLRCEFVNQGAFGELAEHCVPEKIAKIEDADKALLRIAGRLGHDDLAALLAELEQAFEARDRAMSITA